MTRAVAVLRPEPGNAATAGRLEAIGVSAIRLPLFAVRPLDWSVPDPARFDALVLTSANAARLGGPGLARLAALPAYVVGEATALAARAAGLTVAMTGDSDGAALVAAAADVKRGLLLSGRERMLDAGGIIAEAIAVYASDMLPVADADVNALTDAVVLLHSARAARRLSDLIDPARRRTIRVAALSPAIASAAGSGWESLQPARTPTDDALLALARQLAD
ncbi:MAG: uroporphyrinogen-III synthase [Pseudomonadota bacterium]